MCDTLVALPAATGDTTIFAKNSDRPPGEVQVLEVLPARPADGPVRCTWIDVDPAPALACVVTRPLWSWGVEHGVNEAGVAIGNEAIFTTLDPRPAPPALTGLDLVRLGLERAATAADAVQVILDLLDRYGQGGSCHDPAVHPKPYWSSFLVADPTSAYVVETSGRDRAVEHVVDVRAISNRTTIAAFDAAHRHPAQPVETRIDPRWSASRALLAQRPVTVDAVLRHLRSHDSCVEPGWSVCMHADEETTASLVARLSSDGSEVWVATGAPCRTEYECIRI